MDVAALSDLRNTRRLVIKVGSALLVQDGAPRAEWLATLAAEIAELRHKTEIIVVLLSSKCPAEVNNSTYQTLHGLVNAIAALHPVIRIVHFTVVADLMLHLEDASSKLVPLGGCNAPWFFWLWFFILKCLDCGNCFPDGFNLLRVYEI